MFRMKIINVSCTVYLQNYLSINVYMTDRTGEEKWHVYISKRRDNEAINLLLLSDNEKCHYTLIKNFNAFCRKPKDKHAKEFCPYCMHGFDKRYTNDTKMKKNSAHTVCMDSINDIQMKQK